MECLTNHDNFAMHQPNDELVADRMSVAARHHEGYIERIECCVDLPAIEQRIDNWGGVWY